jgi:hypothetical protein
MQYGYGSHGIFIAEKPHKTVQAGGSPEPPVIDAFREEKLLAIWLENIDI